MARWPGIILYYSWIFFLFLALLIYAISQASNYSDYDCLGSGDVAEEDLLGLMLSYNMTLPANITAVPNTAFKTKTNISSIVSIMTVLYGVELGLVALVWIFLFRLSNLEVTKFASPGWFNRCLGCLSKLIPFAIVLVHYIVLVLIIVLFILLFLLRTCYWTYKAGDSAAGHGLMKNASLFTVVAIIGWGLMHCVAGGCYRRNVTFDAYFYTPAVENKCCRWFLINVGP
jgi:hypothetical protein